jgi:hypothetical protein
MWCDGCADTAQVCGVLVLGVGSLRIRDDVRQARDAESAHLEAVLKIRGAQSLRLQQLRDVLCDRGFGEQDDFEYKIMPGDEPRLWLDLSHCVTMEPDVGTYRLTSHGPNQIVTILETSSLDDTVAASARVLSHSRVKAARAGVVEPISSEPAPLWAQTTLVYVWFTGVLTGIAMLALYAIIMKKLPF